VEDSVGHDNKEPDMPRTIPRHRSGPSRLWSFSALLVFFAWLTACAPAAALPLFARQTGQNCVACHAGGQFPELTPYGRLFKMTGYTIGQRTVPISAMAVVSNSRVANTSKSDDPSQDFQKNGSTILATASVFLGGKVTENVGAFVQVTHDPYATQAADGSFQDRTVMDNVDVRYADRFISPGRDLIVGVSVNNNPSVSDPWNTAPAWMQYVPAPSPTSSRFIDANAPYPSFAAGGNLAGITAYGFLNRTWYAELGAYTTSRGALSVMHAGLHNDEVTKMSGTNPYWRFAWSHEWGPNNVMLGTSGMVARYYDDPLDTSDPTTRHRTQDVVLDAQYQYLLDPHSITAQLAFERSRHHYPDMLANQQGPFVDAAGNPLAPTNADDTTRTLRGKVSYVYQAKYGASFGLFRLSGTTNTANQSSGLSPDTLTVTSDPNAQAPSQRVGGNFSGNPDTRGGTLELFWIPIQYMRLGAQYTFYTRYNGAATNYDGFGRNARDNNSLFLYLWAAY
jgi:hypothetical protein